MTKREALRQTQQENTLLDLGFTRDEAIALRRISMTLQRWYELECGNSNDYGSWAIEREDNGDGKPFMVHHHYLHGRGKDYTTRTPIADREAGAVRRLTKIIADRNDREAGALLTDVKDEISMLSYFLQTDPRGAALYILRPGDVPAGEARESYYNRGICIY